MSEPRPHAQASQPFDLDPASTPTPAKPRGRYVLASKLFGSGMIAQLCGFAATAFAASRTTPYDFALFAAVTAATAVIGSANSLAAESRVPVLERDAAEALNRAGFWAVSLIAILTAVVGGIGVAQGQTWGEVLLFTAWTSAMLGVQHLLVGIILRTQQQELLARNRLVQGISNAVLIVALILAGMPGFEALSYAWGISLTLSNVILLPRVRDWLRPGFGLTGRGDYRLLFGQVGWQPLSNLLSDGVGQIPLLVLPTLGAPAVSGAWAVANRFLVPVVNMAQITLQPIYYGRAAAYLRAGDPRGFEHHRRRWSWALLGLAVPVALGCYVAVEWLIPLLGDEWAVASLVVLPACILFPIALSWLPISQSLILTGHLRAQFVYTLVQFVLTAIPFGLAALKIITASDALLIWAILSALGMCAHRLMQRRAPKSA